MPRSAQRKAASRRSRHFKGKLGSGSRFKACKRSVARRGNVRNPAAVCAAIGRRKYGHQRFQAMAAAGRRRH